MNKYKLEITVFLSGALTMMLELIAARVLSPYVGSSNLIWTTIIGIMLISMSIGYWFGGKIADKNKENDIKILLDIHGAKDEHGFDIDLGTAYGENINNNIEILEKLKSYFKKYNIENITENKTFKADSIRTISKYINEETKIPCIQLEISCKYRNLDNLDNIERLIKALEEFILNF